MKLYMKPSREQKRVRGGEGEKEEFRNFGACVGSKFCINSSMAMCL